ncbi:hypothetical protein DN826_03215 [Stutzerimonas nosocomialis]|uniref:hypothetical protein n=1 Tax=Stutzerimonas nosocomialis TaxID=1056496 RepID=UPI0011088B2D|nr:hypothetical protein [Stutzerimonas nosocomialis]TLX58946.1 hypothetical protein DN826_03215 [Stutzerimonas nosocomialis]
MTGSIASIFTSDPLRFSCARSAATMGTEVTDNLEEPIMSKHIIASLFVAAFAGNALAATVDTNLASTQATRVEAGRAEPAQQNIELADARTTDTAVEAKAERSASRVEFRKDRQGLPRWWN